MAKLTKRDLWDHGFNNKYKSCNRNWNFYGFTISQAQDEDDFGNSIPEQELFLYKTNEWIKDLAELKDIYFKETGKHLEIDVTRVGTEIEYW